VLAEDEVIAAAGVSTGCSVTHLMFVGKVLTFTLCGYQQPRGLSTLVCTMGCYKRYGLSADDFLQNYGFQLQF